jgi:uncharacterized protein YciI
MFIVLLRFAAGRSRADALMAGHRRWLQRGFDDGVFLLAGSLRPDLGGAVVAHNTTRAALQQRVDEDPFVVEGVVSAELLEVAVARADERLQAMLV